MLLELFYKILLYPTTIIISQSNSELDVSDYSSTIMTMFGFRVLQLVDLAIISSSGSN